MSSHVFFNFLSLGWFYNSHSVSVAFGMNALAFLLTVYILLARSNAAIKIKGEYKNILIFVGITLLFSNIGIALLLFLIKNPQRIIQSFYGNDIKSIKNLTPLGIQTLYQYLYGIARLVIVLWVIVMVYLLILLRGLFQQSSENECENSKPIRKAFEGKSPDKKLNEYRLGAVCLARHGYLLIYILLFLYGFMVVIHPFFLNTNKIAWEKEGDIRTCQSNHGFNNKKINWETLRNDNFSHIPARLFFERKTPASPLNSVEISFDGKNYATIPTYQARDRSPINILIVPLFPAKMTGLQQRYALMALYLFLGGCNYQAACDGLTDIDTENGFNNNEKELSKDLFNIAGDTFKDRVYLLGEDSPFYWPDGLVNKMLDRQPEINGNLRREILEFIQKNKRTPVEGDSDKVPWLIVLFSWNSAYVKSVETLDVHVSNTEEDYGNALFLDLVPQNSTALLPQNNSIPSVIIDLPKENEYLSEDGLAFKLSPIRKRFSRQQPILDAVNSLRATYFIDLRDFDIKGILPGLKYYPQLFINREGSISLFIRTSSGECPNRVTLSVPQGNVSNKGFSVFSINVLIAFFLFIPVLLSLFIVVYVLIKKYMLNQGAI